MKKLLVIDNYDSFTYNLVQLFRVCGAKTAVYRSDRITVTAVEKQCPDCLLISPGPRSPAFSGISVPLIRALAGKIPIFGVCLGMQCLNEAFGGKTVGSPVPMHGKTSLIYHQGNGIFAGLPSPFTAARYHSLVVEKPNGPLHITATSEDNIIMALECPDFQLFGVQFHPESFLTEYGPLLAQNFLAAG